MTNFLTKILKIALEAKSQSQTQMSLKSNHITHIIV